MHGGYIQPQYRRFREVYQDGKRIHSKQATKSGSEEQKEETTACAEIIELRHLSTENALESRMRPALFSFCLIRAVCATPAAFFWMGKESREIPYSFRGGGNRLPPIWSFISLPLIKQQGCGYMGKLHDKYLIPTVQHIRL